MPGKLAVELPATAAREPVVEPDIAALPTDNAPTPDAETSTPEVNAKLSDEAGVVLAEPQSQAGALPDDAGAASGSDPSTTHEMADNTPGPSFAEPLADGDPPTPSDQPAVEGGDVPAVQTPDAGSAAPRTDTESAATPTLDLLVPAIPQPPSSPAEGPIVAALDDPILQPGASVIVPDAPSVETEPSAAELPPPPPPAPEADPPAETTPEIMPEGEAAVLPSDVPLAPDSPLSGPDSTETERPVAGFSGQVAGVTVGRLPRIGDDAARAENPEDVTDPAQLPPIERYSRVFDNPDGKPAFAIVLVDSGEPDVDRAKLAALPFPVTFALDPTVPNVEELAAPYLAAGQEVVMLATSIPSGATAADLEVTFGAHAAALPEAVAVLDIAEGGFQNDRPLATQIVPIVKGQGRGLITYEQGLNPADQVASREGLRAATVFRVLDAEREPVAAIRRSLDRAAFKAAQDGRVVVVGKTEPDTIAALMEWSLEGRAAGVALAPVTGVLLAR